MPARYRGVLAPAAADRAHIVPGPSPLTEASANCGGGEASRRRHRVEWARLLARVFQVDVTTCDACGGSMKIIAALTEPGAIQRYLDGVGLPARAPPIAPAQPHRQLEFDDAA